MRVSLIVVPLLFTAAGCIGGSSSSSAGPTRPAVVCTPATVHYGSVPAAAREAGIPSGVPWVEDSTASVTGSLYYYTPILRRHAHAIIGTRGQAEIWEGNQDPVVGSWQGLPGTDDRRKSNGCCGFVPPDNHRAHPRRQHHIPIHRHGSHPGLLDALRPQRVNIGIHHVPGKQAAPLSRRVVRHQGLPGATSSSRLPNGRRLRHRQGEEAKGLTAIGRGYHAQAGPSTKAR